MVTQESILIKEKINGVLWDLAVLTENLIEINEKMIAAPEAFPTHSLIKDQLFDAFLGLTNIHYLIESSLKDVIKNEHEDA
jgi:hypothetical protein